MPSLNFPATPSGGDYYEGFQYDETFGVWKRVGGSGAASMTVSETPPVQGLTSGAMWLDSGTGNTYIYYEDGDTNQWIQSSGADIVGARGSNFIIQSTAPGNPADGDVWYDPTNGFTYIYYVDADSSQWVQFGLNRNGSAGANGTNGIDGVDGVGIISGGSTSQVLVKASSTDYDMAWGDIPATLNDLTDTSITAPSSGDLLQYNGSGWVNYTTPVVPKFQTSFVSVDFNNASWTQEPVFDTTPLINIGGFGVTSSAVTVPEAGYYFVSYNIYFTSSGQRVNPGVAVGVNNVRGEEIRSAHSYIRVISAHDESTANASGILFLNANDTLHIYGIQEALDTATNSYAGIGSFNVYKIG